MEENFSLSFAEHQADFYQYMNRVGGLSKKSITNYLSWLKFLANDYVLDKTLTSERIAEILQQEERRQSQRRIYDTKKDLTNFKSSLNKFLAYVQSDYRREKVRKKSEKDKQELDKIADDVQLSETEKSTLVKARIGQGLFRERLLRYWQGCAVSQCRLPWMLIASHIKPWREADNRERLDVYNGLLLLPNYDKLFDQGYISFDDTGHIVISHLLDSHDLDILGISSDLCLARIDEHHKPYLQYHQSNCFICG